MPKKESTKHSKHDGDILRVTKTDQYRTVEELFEHSQPNSSYYTILTLSSLIITSGLLLNNSAIVIGGMLVTPLLTPLLLIGLGIAVGELKAMKNVSILFIKSVLLILFAAVILTAFFGIPRPSQNNYLFENTTRTAILYFIVALASGVVATFAWARKEISEVLPGIAISISLVPPLTLVGIWLTGLQFETARFYFLIFLFNLAGIIVGSLVAFSLLKFYRLSKEVKEKAEENEPSSAEKEK